MAPTIIVPKIQMILYVRLPGYQMQKTEVVAIAAAEEEKMMMQKTLAVMVAIIIVPTRAKPSHPAIHHASARTEVIV